ncbi:MAG: VOC family protein [Hyphomicrobiaceae bacterium]
MSNHGSFYWNELMTRDPEVAKAFYEKTLGWTFQAMLAAAGPTYWVAYSKGKAVGGIFDMSAPEFAGIGEQWMPYVAVDKVDKAVATATKSGATTLRPLIDIDGIGRIAIVRDKVGALLGLISPVAPRG